MTPGMGRTGVSRQQDGRLAERQAGAEFVGPDITAEPRRRPEMDDAT